MERKVKIEGEEFIVQRGQGECVLTVTNGEDEGQVTWHKATQRYRGSFKGWGSDTDSVENAVATAARRIIETRKGVSQKMACEAMEDYLKVYSRQNAIENCCPRVGEANKLGEPRRIWTGGSTPN